MIPAAFRTHRRIMVRSSSPPPSFLMPLTGRFFPLVGRCSRQVPYGDGNQHPPYGYCHRDGHLKVTVLPAPITPSTQEWLAKGCLQEEMYLTGRLRCFCLSDESALEDHHLMTAKTVERDFVSTVLLFQRQFKTGISVEFVRILCDTEKRNCCQGKTNQNL